jgi:hypothetical protein
MYSTRFKTIPIAEFPKGSMADVPQNDKIRRFVSPQNYTFINGAMALTPTGVRELCEAVITGRCPGDAEKSRQLLADLNQTYPTP